MQQVDSLDNMFPVTS